MHGGVDFLLKFHLLPMNKWDLCKAGVLNVQSWAIKVIVDRLFSPDNTWRWWNTAYLPDDTLIVLSQGHYGFHSFPVVNWFCLFI